MPSLRELALTISYPMRIRPAQINDCGNLVHDTMKGLPWVAAVNWKPERRRLFVFGSANSAQSQLHSELQMRSERWAKSTFNPAKALSKYGGR